MLIYDKFIIDNGGDRTRRRSIMDPRKKTIIDMIQRTGRLELHAAARELGVSEMTVRRDLRALEKEKLLVQIRGGAIPLPASYEPENAFSELNDLKFALAEALCRRILPCETMFIGTGTTCLAFARIMARRSLLPTTIITNSLPVASALFQRRCKVMLLGGELRSKSMDLVGPAAEKTLEEYHVEWLVSGCDGAFADYGFYTSDMSLSNLEKRTISIADRTAIVTESCKFGRRSLTRFASLEEIDLLVTDTGLTAEDEIKLRSHDIEVVKTEC
jgi:DeoR family fructose operon transcriptional repressor